MITIYLLDNSYCSADERSLSLVMITIYLLDNSYCSADERHSEQVRQLYRPLWQ
ncbi:MAG: hypothetical protein SWX82_19465 [Cyanobacteriota bacterium]|nr:hypothetical protein [Cyanobacteriota bacterium]